jgi:putative glutamine amidotransferase
MAAPIRIGVTGNSRKFTPSWWCISFALRLVGAKPIRISTRHDQASIDTLDGLIISGGDDISPEHYAGEELPSARIDHERDALEIDWIKRALEADTPLLGICRGSQLINIVLGGSLHQDLRQLRVRTYNRPGLLPTKQVFLEPESEVQRATARSRLRVNSLHHQAIDKVGEGLSVVGRDLDDITQAVEHVDGKRIIGVQWHPEYLFYLPSQLRLFRWITRAST